MAARKPWALTSADFKYLEGSTPEIALERAAQRKLLEYLNKNCLFKPHSHGDDTIAFSVGHVWEKVCEDLDVKL